MKVGDLVIVKFDNSNEVGLILEIDEEDIDTPWARILWGSFEITWESMRINIQHKLFEMLT
tara:strand:+ start:2162 stop:2344 length:183 start_codon:yes stop_codon:yes gene_type:complete